MAEDVNLPTQEEIATLPRWAMVGFAARCARRVLPRFTPSEELPEFLSHAVDQAVELAERVAATNDVPYCTIDDAGAHAAKVTFFVANQTAQAVAEAASCAAQAATSALDANDKHSSASSLDASAHVSYHAHNAALAASKAADVIAVIRHDYQIISDAVQSGRWTNSTLIPSSIFGPLWPDGPPDWWQTAQPLPPSSAQAAVRGIILDLFADHDTPDEVIEKGLVQLYTILNKIHMAKGAGVLQVDEFRQLIVATPAVGG